VPALTSFLGVEPRFAVGTSAVVVLAVSCTACQTYFSRGLVSLRTASAIAVTALVTARLGASQTAKVNPKTLKRYFGGWLLIASSLIAAKAAGLTASGAVLQNVGATVAVPPLLILGAATGLISGLLGVGGGTVLVPALTLGFHFPQALAQGSALMAILPPAITSTLTHLQKGNVDRSLVGGAVLGALAGSSVGSTVAARLPERALRMVFAVVLAGVGAKYLRS